MVESFPFLRDRATTGPVVDTVANRPGERSGAPDGRRIDEVNGSSFAEWYFALEKFSHFGRFARE